MPDTMITPDRVRELLELATNTGRESSFLRFGAQLVGVRREELEAICGDWLQAYATKTYSMTKHQAELLAWIGDYVMRVGAGPSYQDIAAARGYSSLSTVHEHLANLVRKGWLVKRFNEARSIALTPAAEAWMKRGESALSPELAVGHA